MNIMKLILRQKEKIFNETENNWEDVLWLVEKGLANKAQKEDVKY